MLSVQNSEAWALSQANPKTEPISPQTEPVFREVFPKHRDGFFPQTEPVFHKHRAYFSKSGASQKRWRISPKSVTDFPKIGDGFPQNR